MSIDPPIRRGPPGRPPFTEEERALQIARGVRANKLNERMESALSELDALGAPGQGPMTLIQLTAAVRRISRTQAAIIRMRLGKFDEDPPA